MIPELPLVVVEWDDAWGDMTAVVTPKDVNESHRAEIITTIGWLLQNDDRGISIASEYCADGTYRGRSFVPAGMIRSVTPYKLSKPRQPKMPK